MKPNRHIAAVGMFLVTALFTITKYVITDLHGQSKHHEAPDKYVMHFDKGQMPPVDGFWSLTMYNAEYFFVDNPLNRYTLSARNDLKKKRGCIGGSVSAKRKSWS
jgi:hypothetical protein